MDTDFTALVNGMAPKQAPDSSNGDSQPPEGQTTTPQGSNQFTDLVDQVSKDRVTQAQAATAAMQGTDAEKSAKALELGKQFGLPAAAVIPNLGEYTERAQMLKNNKVIEENPSIAAWVANQPDAAQAGKDDFDKLNAISKISVTLAGMNVPVMENQLGRAGSELAGENLTGSDTTATQARIAALKSGIEDYNAYTPTGAYGKVSWGINQAAGLLDNFLNALPEVGGGAAAGAAAGLPEGGVGAIPGALAGAATGLKFGLAGDWARVTNGQTYLALNDMRDRNGQPLTEHAKQIGSGIASALTFGIGMVGGPAQGAVVTDAAKAFTQDALKEALHRPTVVTALSTIAKDTAVGAGQGALMMGGMTLASQLGQEIGKQIGPGDWDTVANNPKLREAYIKQLGDAIEDGALTFGMLHGVGGAVGEYGNYKNSQASIEVFHNLMDQSAESKTKQRSPDAFQTFMQSQVGDTGAENVYVPAAKIQEMYHKSGVSPGPDDGIFGKAVPDIDQQLKQSGPLNGDVVIPTANYAAHIAGTPMDAQLREVIRMSPDGMNMAEQKEFEQKYQDILSQMGDHLKEQQNATESQRAIFEDMQRKAQEAGFTASQAAQYGAITAARYSTRGERLGMDPLDLYHQQGIELRRGTEGELPEQALTAFPAKQVPNAVTLDDMDKISRERVVGTNRPIAELLDQLNTAEGAAKEKKPLTLTQWLKKQGGIKDEAGEMKGLDANKQMKGLVTKNGLSHDEAALRAWEAGYIGKIGGERPTIQELRMAIADDLRKKNVTSQHELNIESDRQAPADELAKILNEHDIPYQDRETADILHDMEAKGIIGEQPTLRAEEAKQEEIKTLEEKLPPAPHEGHFEDVKNEKPEKQDEKTGKVTPEEKPNDLNAPIEDFGDKLEGAKKDLWKDYQKSLSEELPTDAKDITLAKHFPDPDYEAMIANGVDVKVLAAIKAMRDEVPAKPKMEYKLRRWAEMVKTLRGLADSMINGEVPLDKVMEKMDAGSSAMRDFVPRIELYAELGYPLFTKAKGWDISQGNYSMIGGEKFNPPKLLYTLRDTAQGRKSFGGMGGDKGYFNTREEAIAALRKRLETQPEQAPKSTQLDIYRVTKSGEVIIGKKVGTGKFLDLKGGFENAREARQYLKDNEKALLELLQKKKEIRPERRSTNDPRIGADYREGQNVPPEKFASEFGFRGVQFGNYVEQAKRVRDLNNAYDSLLDLANTIGVPSRALSLNGDLGLAFGARGSGGKNAHAAHYEPDNVVINLTKNSGAGSLGHEWWHALDNYLGKKREGAKADTYLTENTTVPTRMNAERTGSFSDVSVRKELVDAYKGVMDAIKASDLRKRSLELDKTRGKDYWSTQIEMSARAFESYLIDKAKEAGGKNDYLANIIDEKTHNAFNELTGDTQSYPYPTEAEKPAINAAFDKLFQTLATRETPNGTEFYQGSAPEMSQDGRAKVTIAEGQHIISLFEGADKTAILHEMGHIWLTELQADAARSDAPEQIKKDWDTVKKYIGHEEGAIGTESHETFARSIEQYLMEGKAPSNALVGAFRRFKQWFTNIYCTVANLHVDLNDDVRKVFDRMLATDDEISQMETRNSANQLFKTKEDGGMSEAEFKTYNEKAFNIQQAAREQLLTEALADIRKKNATEWNKADKEIRPETADAVKNRQDIRALDWFRTGQLRDAAGEVREVPAMEILRSALPPGAEKDLPKGVVVSPEGEHPDDIAPILGYASGNDMINDLRGLGKTEQSIGRKNLQKYITDQEVDTRLKQKFGVSDDQLRQKAEAMVGDTDRIDMKLAELRALARKDGQPVTFTKENIGKWADDHMDAMKASDGANVFQFVRAAAKAGREAAKAVEGGKDKEAIQALQKQALNMALAERARVVEKDYNSGMKLFKRLAGEQTIKSTEQSYLNQVHSLLQSIGMRVNRDARELSNSLAGQGLKDFIVDKVGIGRDIYVADDFMDKAPSLASLNVDQFRDLADMVKSLMHNGRDEQSIIRDGKRVEKDRIITEILENMATFKSKEKSEFLNPADAGFLTRCLDKFTSMLRAADSELLRPEQFMDWLDKRNVMGPLNTHVFRPLKEAQIMENDLLAEQSKAFHEMDQGPDWHKSLKDEIPNSTLIDPDTKKPARLSRKTMLTIALNTGNESNLKKLTEGYNWKASDVNDLLQKNMTKQDWDFTQYAWDSFEKLWPKIEEMQRRTSGVAPPKIEATPIKTIHGDYRGGYYPVVYDPNKTQKGGGYGGAIFDNDYYRPTTAKGHTISRVQDFSDRIMLNLDVLPWKLRQAIHDLSFREAITNADKILSDQRFTEALKDKWGPEYGKEFRPWLKDIANQPNADNRPMSFIDNALRYSRMTMVEMGIGFRLTTMLKHGLTAFSNSVGELGPDAMRRGVQEFYSDREAKRDMVFEKSGELRHRINQYDRDIRENMASLMGEDSTLHNMRRFGHYGVAFLDLESAIPTWIASYRKSLADGLEEKDAIFAADKTVRNAHGAQGQVDLAGVQRGPEYKKLFTMFYGFFNHMYNRERDIGHRIATDEKVDMSMVLARTLSYIMVPALVEQAVSGHGHKDEGWGHWAARAITNQMASTIPFIRDLSGYLESGRAQETPMSRSIRAIGDQVKDVKNVATGQPVSDKWVKHAIETPGYVVGAPTGQLATSTQFLWDINNGKENPHDVADWLHGLMYGTAKAK